KASAVNAMPVLQIADPVMIGMIGPEVFPAPFAGRIDEIAFFNAPLAADDVVRLFTLGIGGGCVVPSNRPPTGDAGTDQVVNVGDIVTLDGSRSSDPDGDALTYSWTFTAVPPASSTTPTGETTAMPTFVADIAGTYVAQLVVNDGRADSLPATVHVTTRNRAPLANAGANQTVAVGATVILDGSGSFDPDGDPLTYSWTLTTTPPGSAAALAGAATATPMFVADVAGTYTAQLLVADGRGGSASAMVT